MATSNFTLAGAPILMMTGAAGGRPDNPARLTREAGRFQSPVIVQRAYNIGARIHAVSIWGCLIAVIMTADRAEFAVRRSLRPRAH